MIVHICDAPDCGIHLQADGPRLELLVVEAPTPPDENGMTMLVSVGGFGADHHFCDRVCLESWARSTR